MSDDVKPLATKTPKDVIHAAKEHGAKIVDLRFIDLPGLWQHFSIPTHDLDEDLFSEGIGFDGSSIRGFQEIQESDMLLIPDPNTAVLDPFRQHTTLNINCFVQDPVTGESYSRDPRYIAQKAEAYLRSTGIADVSYWGPEAEFFVFDNVQFDSRSNGTFYSVDSDEAMLKQARAAKKPFVIRPGRKSRPCLARGFGDSVCRARRVGVANHGGIVPRLPAEARYRAARGLRIG